MQALLDENERVLRELLKRYDRIGITGAPKAGKSTLTARIRDRAVLHTDDWIDAGWAEAPLEVIKAAALQPTLLVVEGVIVPRAIRKGLPLDALLWLPKPLIALSTRQAAMAQSQLTVLEGLSPRLPVFTPVDTGNLPQWIQVIR